MVISTAEQRAQAVTDRARLQEALMSALAGERAKSINYAERGASFTEVDTDKIKKEITEIDNAIAVYDGSCNKRRPMKVRW